jgi:uncharacterized damage-inducible protein DinB
MTKAEFLQTLQIEWDSVHTAIAQLSDAQLTGARSADGWSVKDHLAHLMVWERSTLAIVLGQPRHQALGIDEATYANGDYDRTNALIHAQHRDQSLAAVHTEWDAVHQQLLAALAPLADAALQRPDTDYLPGERGIPLLDRLIGNTIEHYAEHLEWFSSLVSNAP